MRAALLALLLLAAALPAQAWNLAAPHDDVLVAVIDTGADAMHPEFGGYRGEPGVRDPQIVAWWDFGVDGPPPPGATWDAVHPVPSDSAGHGTGTASLVGGKTLGTCPGVKLAIAKVADATGNLTGDIGAAIRWASVTLGADVISMSFGSTVASLAAADDLDERVDEAWRMGALPVASAGNGIGNAGVKEPNEVHSPSYSPRALAVGAGDERGTRLGTLVDSSYSNLDPDVIAWGTDVPMAAPGGGHVRASGTSFSAPKVAGYAACLMRAAHAAQRDAGPDRIARLLEWTARDDAAVPYAAEGYGFVDEATYRDALGYAQRGELPNGPRGAANAPPAFATHAARGALTSAEPTALLAPLPGAEASVLRGPSLPAGMQRVALFRVPAEARQVLQLALAYDSPAGPAPQDLDLYLLRPGAGSNGLLSVDDVLASSTGAARPGANAEQLAIAAGQPGDQVVAVLGYALDADQPFTLRATLDGQPAELSYAGEFLAAGAFEQL